jgi:hypothetical protein
LALVALLVIRSGDGSSRADLGDLGDQADPSSVGAAVDAAIGAGERGALPTESSTMCAAETRGSYGQGLGSLVYSARLRWQGVAAMALAYRVTGAQTAGLDHRVFVVSIAGCQLLVAQSL